MPRNQGGRIADLERDLACRVTPSLGCSTFTFAPHGTRRLHAAERSTCSTPKPPAATCKTAPAVYAPRVRCSPSVVPKGTAPSRRVGRRSGSGPASLRWSAPVGVEQCGPIPPPSRETLSPTYRQVCGEISTLGVRKRVQEQRRLNPDQTLSLVTLTPTQQPQHEISQQPVSTETDPELDLTGEALNRLTEEVEADSRGAEARWFPYECSGVPFSGNPVVEFAVLARAENGWRAASAGSAGDDGVVWHPDDRHFPAKYRIGAAPTMEVCRADATEWIEDTLTESEQFGITD